MKHLAVSLLALAACSKPAAPAPKPAPAPAPASSARTAWIEPGPAQGLAILEWPAQVVASPAARARITAPLRARVVSVRTAPGAEVKQGEPLVEVAIPELAQAAASLGAAELRIAAYGERVKQLEQLRAEGLARVEELADARVKLAEAQADRTTAMAVLRTAGQRDSDAPALLKSGGVTSLRAPIAGVVTRVNATPGELRDVGSEPLVELAARAGDRIEARAGREPAAQMEYAFVVPGHAPVKLARQATSPEVESDGSRRTWFTASADPGFAAGQPGVVRVALVDPASAASVPARALRLTGGRAELVVRRGEQVLTLPVEVLLSSSTIAVVRGPLQPGDSVAADASQVELGGGES